MFEFDGRDTLHEYIFIDEAGFNLTKRRRRGRNIIGRRAIVEVPGQRGGNVTLCAPISHIMQLPSCNLGPLQHTTSLGFPQPSLWFHYPAWSKRARTGRAASVIWDNVSFHRAALVRNWFSDHPRFSNMFLPAYSPFLNPIEEFFSAWRWKVYDRNPYEQANLLQAMEESCGDIAIESIQGWIRHSRAYFPRCLARENIYCDVDEGMWPDPAQRRNAEGAEDADQ